MCNELSNTPTICGGDKAAEGSVMSWQERLITGFNQVHAGLLNIRKAVNDSTEFPPTIAASLVDNMEYGALAPMRKLRNLYNIPYDWSEKD